MRTLQQRRTPKHLQIRDELHGAITRAEYKDGQRIPSEIELAKRFGVSRPTVARALRDLERDGLVQRRAGAGTYIRATRPQERYVFGLLIREVGEIFEPICHGLAHAAEGTEHELILGNQFPDLPRAVQAERLCEQYVERKVSGVFWAPLELTERKDEVNRRIAEQFDRARIPVVLLDRDMCAYPQRSHYDLVGVDNHRLGYTLTRHVLDLGCRRVVFAARPNSAPTVERRIAGYREALLSRDITPDPEFVRLGDPGERTFVGRIINDIHPDAIVCANDATAAHLMRSLALLGVRIPVDVRIVGVDDLRYASLLHIPLTTVRQPCRDMCVAALAAMFERISHPDMPARDILLDFRLIVRQSCGATLQPEGENGIPLSPLGATLTEEAVDDHVEPENSRTAGEVFSCLSCDVEIISGSRGR